MKLVCLTIAGNRECIGKRFAMVEMKIAAAKLLAKYRLVAVPETKLDPQRGDTILISFECMKVKLERRS